MAINLPEGLPDQRTAGHLLDVLDKLEAHLATTHPVNVPAELAFLRKRATLLEGARQQALSRLETLINRVEKEGMDAEPESPPNLTERVA